MVPPKGVYLPILKLHSIIIKANLFAHNLCLFYYGQLNLVRLKSSAASKWTIENVIFITQKPGATPKNRLHFKNQHKKYIKYKKKENYAKINSQYRIYSKCLSQARVVYQVII